MTPKLYAQSSNLKTPSELGEAQGRSVLLSKKKTDAQVYGHIRLEGMQYMTPIAEQPNLTYSQFLSARLSALKETGWFDAAMDISGGTFFSLGQSHFVVHEAYIATQGKDFKITAGRK